MFKFRKITADDLALLMSWRSSEHVTRYMSTDISQDCAEQYKWFDSINKDHYWICKFGNIPIGLINLADYQPRHKRSSFGFYIGDRDYWYLGGFVTPCFYNYVFNRDDLGIKKITAEVFAQNDRVISLHMKHGFRYVGRYIDHIYKNDTFHSIDVLELHEEIWSTKNQYNKYIGEWL